MVQDEKKKKKKKKKGRKKEKMNFGILLITFAIRQDTGLMLFAV